MRSPKRVLRNELNEKRLERATVSEESEERLSWRLATKTPEGVSKGKEKTLEEEREEAVRAQ